MSSTPSQVFKKMVQVATSDSFMESVRRMFFYKTIRPGKLVGTDQFGNKYFEAPAGNMELRERFIEFGGKKGDMNACRLPPEWHMWATRISLLPPTKIKLEQPKYAIQWNPPELSKLAQNANYLPSHYKMKAKDVQPVVYPKNKYTAWTPPAV